MLKHPLPQEVIDAFHLMWDHFPEPASLVHKSREVIAVNKDHGLIPGVYCSKIGKRGPHTGCLADKALAGKKTVAIAHPDPSSDRKLVSYWIPLDGYPEYFVHVSVRMAIDFEKKTFALKPVTEEEKEEGSFYQETNEYLYKRKACESNCEKCQA